MTREEREKAIATLSDIYTGDYRLAEALKCAIEALKAETPALEGMEIISKACYDKLIEQAAELERIKATLPEGYEILTKEAYSDLCLRAAGLRGERPKGGDFTRQELENWLYSICLNNVGTDFCKDTEEIISRLDGFEQYVKDMRGSEQK